MLSDRLRDVFELLKKTEPLPEEYDVVWQGPYYIPRRREWCPTRFTLFSGVLYAFLFIRPVWHGLSWKIGSDEIESEPGFSMSGHRLDEAEWADAFAQIEHRLRSALKSFPAYNRRVARLLPPTCRTGKIQRRLTLPRGAKPPMPTREIKRFEAVTAHADRSPALEEMTLSSYLNTVAVAYDSAFEDLRALTALEKYRRRADGRHGGLLDLPPHCAEAFAEWFRSGTWRGTHPWEVVFGHPQGIMIAPRHDTDARRWHYLVWVDSEMWYATAARMAIALASSGAPFDFHDWKKVAAALHGVDEVEVGADLYTLSFEELREVRPDALGAIRWDPIPQLAPITPEQLARVRAAESGD